MNIGGKVILTFVSTLSESIIHNFHITARFDADLYNKMKNMASKVIGEKMKVSFLISYNGDGWWNSFSNEIKKSKGDGKEQAAPKSLLPFGIDDLDKCSEEKLSSIESHLENRSYLIDFEPTTLDKEAFVKLKARKKLLPDNLFQNIHRWFRHIDSFSVEEQNKFTVSSMNSLILFLSTH